MIGKCALYDIQTELKLGHIIPKFVFDFLKKTGGKYLRTYERPNQRIQDGPKKYLLSERGAEFSKRERWFVNNIFLPYMKEGKKFLTYDESFAYFTVSILWRVLIDQLDDPEIFNDERFTFLPEVREEWKAFLSKGVFPRNYNDLNIILTDRVSSHNTNGINVDLYLSRMIDATIISNKRGSKVVIYIKFLRFIFWCVVKGPSNNCKETQIDFIKGCINIPQKVRDDFIGDFINSRIQEIDNKPSLSLLQQNIINLEISRTEGEFWNTDAGLAMINDYNIRSGK